MLSPSIFIFLVSLRVTVACSGLTAGCCDVQPTKVGKIESLYVCVCVCVCVCGALGSNA